MSVIDRSWSEPHGLPVVAPEVLATGTAAHAAARVADAEPRRFLGMPVIAPRTATRADAPAGRPDHDATSLVDPLPAPPRPGARGQSAPRAAAIPDAHAARSRQRRSDRRRLRIAILAGVVAGALACGVTVLSSRELDLRAARQQQPPQQPQQQPLPQRAVVPDAAPAAAAAAPAKPRRASTAAPKKPAAAPKRTAAKQPGKPAPAAAKQPAPAKPAPAKPAPTAAKQPAPAKPAPAKSSGSRG